MEDDAPAKKAVPLKEEIRRLVEKLSEQVQEEVLGDLQCPQCGCMLNDPWTLGSGRTVCASCVARVTGEHVPPVANRILGSIVQLCLPHSAEAAARRVEGNEHFKKAQWEEAVAAYGASLVLDESSPAAYANRSAAQLKLKAHCEAIKDATRAVELRPNWVKSHLRLAAALRADDQDGQAVMSLLHAAAIDGDAGANTQLVELAQSGQDMPTLDKHIFPSAPAPRRVPAEEVQSLREEFDCCMCSNIFCEPTVLPCGHCMCRGCTARLLDHALQTEPSCPLCRHNLKPLLQQINKRAREEQRAGIRFAHGAAQLTVCTELARLLAGWFPTECAERLAEEQAPQSEWVPIFVCSLSAPFIPTPLHIFEPRYRLMMRRCVESNQRFGMCLPTEEGFQDTGTMLFIDRFEQLPDGRSKIGTRGVSRFTVLKRGELDGYSTALIQPFEEDAQGFPESQKFHREALALRKGVSNLFELMLDPSACGDPSAQDRLEQQLGPVPAASSAHFDAHMSFYVPNLLAALTGGEDADLIFMQPESERWKKILQKCARVGPFAAELEKVQKEVDDEKALGLQSEE